MSQVQRGGGAELGKLSQVCAFFLSLLLPHLIYSENEIISPHLIYSENKLILPLLIFSENIKIILPHDVFYQLLALVLSLYCPHSIYCAHCAILPLSFYQYSANHKKGTYLVFTFYEKKIMTHCAGKTKITKWGRSCNSFLCKTAKDTSYVHYK